MSIRYSLDSQLYWPSLQKTSRYERRKTYCEWKVNLQPRWYFLSSLCKRNLTLLHILIKMINASQPLCQSLNFNWVINEILKNFHKELNSNGSFELINLYEKWCRSTVDLWQRPTVGYYLLNNILDVEPKRFWVHMKLKSRNMCDGKVGAAVIIKTVIEYQPCLIV